MTKFLDVDQWSQLVTDEQAYGCNLMGGKTGQPASPLGHMIPFKSS